MPEARIIADAGPLVAFLVKEDLHHEWAKEQFGHLQAPFLTCEPVLTEAFYLVHRLRDGKKRFFELLHSGVLAVDFVLMDERTAVTKLVRKYEDVPMSLADACVVRMAELCTEAIVLTVDGDFHTYRKHGKQVIPAILPEGV